MVPGTTARRADATNGWRRLCRRSDDGLDVVRRLDEHVDDLEPVALTHELDRVAQVDLVGPAAADPEVVPVGAALGTGLHDVGVLAGDDQVVVVAGGLERPGGQSVAGGRATRVGAVGVLEDVDVVVAGHRLQQRCQRVEVLDGQRVVEAVGHEDAGDLGVGHDDLHLESGRVSRTM